MSNLLFEELNSQQQRIIQSSLDKKRFIVGSAGTGKTTAAVERLSFLLSQGVPGESILMLTPQRSLQEPYTEILQSPERIAGGDVTPATIGGLARRMTDLFWPLAAEVAGFANPDQPPMFLTLETAQYYMAYLVRPLLDMGYFESITINRNRLYSQIIDNLNKAAAIGFPHTEIGQRLDVSYFGDPAQRRVYLDAQDCANRFRQYCLEHNLLDFSFQLEVFTNYLWPQQIVRDYLTKTYRHLIYDNVEEDIPRAHDIVREWLPSFDSALLVYDEDGGFRHFLGADVKTGYALRELCEEVIEFKDAFVMSDEVERLSSNLVDAIDPGDVKMENDVRNKVDGSALSILQKRFYPELIDSVADGITHILNAGVAPSEIVILAPYLSDALRFSITQRLDERAIPWRSHRPSRSLRDEPASHSLITLAALGHPHWNIHPPKFDVAYAFMRAFDGLDLVRAQLLTDIVYRQRDLRFSSFQDIKSDVQERITYSIGERYSTLRTWIEEYREGGYLPLDHFFRKIFGEVLSQPGFGYHNDFDSVRVASSLVESVKKFRLAMEPSIVRMDTPSFDFGREYISMLSEGVIAASYVEAWRNQEKDAVLVAPAHTFLMMNRPVTIQFWLDVGSNGWYERLAQPLTHPHVLSREWEPGRQWMDADEVDASKKALARLVSGLLHRCRKKIYLCLSELGENGFEQRGELLRAFQKVLQEERG